jgi:hypothetical protein
MYPLKVGSHPTTTPKQDISIPKSNISRQETGDKTDKYIQLLQDRIIDKADFLKLISANKTETNDYIY